MFNRLKSPDLCDRCAFSEENCLRKESCCGCPMYDSVADRCICTYIRDYTPCLYFKDESEAKT